MDHRLARFVHSTEPALLAPETVRQRLLALRDTLVTYVPADVVRIEGSGASPPPTCDARHASLLFADVSGFTALSEQLATLGREGAEQVTDAINAYFSAILTIIARYHGSVLKFGGDALVVAFFQAEHARASASAALALQQQMGAWEAQSSLGNVPLRLSIGLGSGTLRLFRLGNSQRREIVLLGQAAEEIARAEEIATAGEIVGGPGLVALLPAGWIEREEAGHGWLDGAHPPDPPEAEAPPPPPPAADETQLVEELDALVPYLPEGLLDRLRVDSDGRVEGEHRMVTVLFCNVSSLPDGEERLAEVLQDHFVTMQATISRFGGTINKIDVAREGYKLMALFGAPLSHEDNETRAVLAALAMQEAMAGLNERGSAWLDYPCELVQRIGIHSGVVFAGNVGSKRRQEYSVMGDHVNLAARVMGQCPPGEILISAATGALLGAQAQLTALAPVRVKGKSEPVQLFRVEGWHDAAPRIVAQRAPLVAREKELQAMRRALALAAAGQGQSLYLHGEAGIGKSRLVAEIVGEAPAFLALEGRCLSYGTDIPYHPWRPVLHALLGVDPSLPPSEQEAIARAQLANELPEQGELFPLLAPALGIDTPHTPSTAALTPQLRQQRLLALVGELVVTVAQRQPLLLVMDDVHWIDAVSAELLAYVARQVGDGAILLLILGRTPVQEQFAGHGSDVPRLPFFRTISVGELAEAEALALAEALLARHDLSEAEQRLVLERASGNPLYIEELADAISNEEVEVPDTLQGLIMSRLDRLPETSRRLLQVASVIGRRFDLPLLDGVYPFADRTLRALPERLDDLTSRDVLTVERVEPAPSYLFRHVLTHEVTYESLLFARRRELHQRVGHFLEESAGDGMGERYGLLSYHYYQAQAWSLALPYTLIAADRARESYANDAAISLYRRALEILSHSQPLDTVTRAQVLQSLGDVLKLVGRFDDALDRYQQALELTADAGGQLELFERKVGALVAKGEVRQGLEQIEEAHEVARRAGNAARLRLARLQTLQGWLHSHLGDYPLALDTTREAISLLESLSDASGEMEIALATALDYLAGILIMMRRLEDALAHTQRVLALRQAMNDLRGIASVYDRMAQIYWMQDDKEQAMHTLNRSLDVRRKIGDAFGLVAGLNNLGILYFHMNHLDEAERSYLECLQFARRIGSVAVAGHALSNLVELRLAQGRLLDAAHHIEEATPILLQTGDQETLAELEGYRQELSRRQAALLQESASSLP